MGKIWLKSVDPSHQCCGCEGKAGPCDSCCTFVKIISFPVAPDVQTSGPNIGKFTNLTYAQNFFAGIGPIAPYYNIFGCRAFFQSEGGPSPHAPTGTITIASSSITISATDTVNGIIGGITICPFGVAALTTIRVTYSTAGGGTIIQGNVSLVGVCGTSYGSNKILDGTSSGTLDFLNVPAGLIALQAFAFQSGGITLNMTLTDLSANPIGQPMIFGVDYLDGSGNTQILLCS